MPEFRTLVPAVMLVITTCTGVGTASGHYSLMLQGQTPGTETDVGFFVLLAALGALISVVSYVGVSRTLPPVLDENEHPGRKGVTFLLNWLVWSLIGVLFFIWGGYELLDAIVL